MLLFIITKKGNDIQKKPFNIKLTNQYTNGLGKCKNILLKNLRYNNIQYSHYVYQIDFDMKNQFEKDKSSDKEIIALRLLINNSYSLKKNIYINKTIEKRHYFLYDVDFYDKLKKINISDLELRKCEQFNLFKDAISQKDFNSENVEKDFLIDSLDNLIDKDNIFSVELLLEILDFYYNKNEGNILIKFLEDKWDYIYNCKELNSYYNNILINLKKKFDKEFENKFYNKNVEILINFLLIYRAKHEKEKVQEIFKMKFYWKFISKIIIRKLDFYINLGIEIPKGLICKMLVQKNLTPGNILKILLFRNSVSEILEIIIDNFNALYNTCKQNNYKIAMHTFQKKEYIDDIEKLINNIMKLIQKESEYQYSFASFDEEFWLYYINYYMKDIKKLKHIENTISSYCNILCSNLNKNDLCSIIHEKEIQYIKSLGLKNENILKFFEEIYLKGNNNNNEIEFPYDFLNEINLETADGQFFIKWKEMNMLSYISNKSSFIVKILDKITKIEYFGNIFKLFRNIKEENPEIIINLMNKFNELMETYSINKCKNFIVDSSYLIYLIDSPYNNFSVDFLNSVILKKIDSNEIKTNICLNLLSNPHLSINLISFIIRYYLLNKNILNDKIEQLIIKKLNDENYKQVIKEILNNLNELNIKKEELFNEEENLEFLILLKKIHNIIKYQEFDLNISFKDPIFNDLKNGNIKYDLIHSWLTDNEKNKLLIERLNILAFYNTKEVNDCLKSLENDFNKINENVKKVEKLKEILKVFFPLEQQQNIEYINNYENELKDKLLKDIKNNFDISNFINDLNLDEMDKLKSSNIFLSILNKKKGQNQNNNEIEAFKRAQKDYNKLKELLNINWEDNIIEIIDKYSIRELTENEIEKELFILKNYFEMTNIKESEIMERKKALIFIIKKREEIITYLNNSFNFILEFTIQNDRNNLNNLKDTITKNINLAMINKHNNNNLIEKYFLNLSENIYHKTYENIANEPNSQFLTNVGSNEEKMLNDDKMKILIFPLYLKCISIFNNM